jgi:hypothetical protein
MKKKQVTCSPYFYGVVTFILRFYRNKTLHAIASKKEIFVITPATHHNDFFIN